MLNVLNCAAALGMDGQIDEILPGITTSIVTIIKIVIPVILIFLGMVDLGKAVVSNDEKEMKNSQTRLIKRVVYAVLIFLIVAIVQLIFGVIAKNDKSGAKDGISTCINCFISNDDC